ncbi:MAG TPA: phenylalanine--tRNA ligase subunit beta, partial [Patescibacteria group bacterium]
MFISLNWLKDFVDLSKISPRDLGLKLTIKTMEIENVVEQGQNLENIVIGQVLEIKDHPNADKLKIVVVDDGSGQREVVCGGLNLKQGQLVALARQGARVSWHGQEDLTELKKTKIRGVESSGMICAAEEIGFEKEGKAGEIMDLSYLGKVRLGTPLKKALELDDTLFEIDNKSITHRPDLWGHYGVAREVAAFLGKKLKKYPAPDFKAGSAADLKIKVADFKHCRRFMGVMVGNIRIEPSPLWLVNRLRAVNIRPINNIVDITNYVMTELGQPMHAYDRQMIRGDQLGTRLAKAGEKFTTLDEESWTLTKDDLLIVDQKGPVGLAGLMGGLKSAITDQTKEIILEAANFDPVTVRKTSKRLGLRSDSSARFEKSLDPDWPELAIKRAVSLIKQLIPEAEVISPVVDQTPVARGRRGKLNQGPIVLNKSYLAMKMGLELADREVIKILKDLGFEVNSTKADYKVIAPTWRATKDIAIPDDLVEEVARIYGYDQIPTKLPNIDITPPARNLELLVERKIKNFLVYGPGWTEVYNYSFVNEKQLENLGIDYSRHIKIQKPLSSDQTLLRQSLIPSLLKNTVDNLRFYDQFKLFEIEQVFLPDLKGPVKDPSGKDKLPG